MDQLILLGELTRKLERLLRALKDKDRRRLISELGQRAGVLMKNLNFQINFIKKQ